MNPWRRAQRATPLSLGQTGIGYAPTPACPPWLQALALGLHGNVGQKLRSDRGAGPRGKLPAVARAEQGICRVLAEGNFFCGRWCQIYG